MAYVNKHYVQSGDELHFQLTDKQADSTSSDVNDDAKSKPDCRDNRRMTKIIAIVVASVVIAGIVALVLVLVLTPTEDFILPTEGPTSIRPTTPETEVVFQNAAVATDVEVCSQMGRDILQLNGSAVDSAITSLLCIGVVNGQSSGLGGGFFMVVYNRNSLTIEALNALETAYAATYPEMFDGQGADGAKYGMESVAIPGELRGMWDAHQRYGQLPWSDLFQPVIDIARNGFEVGDHLSDALSSLENQWDEFPNLRTMYYIEEEDRVAERGDIITRADLADTLQAIADNGVDEFYTGQTATKLVHDIQAGGGGMVLGDLANYTAKWTDVEILQRYSRSNYTVFSSQPTSSGPTLQFFLRTMEGFDLPSSNDMSFDETVDLYHRFIEVCKFGFATRTHLGDTWSEEVERALGNLRSPQFSDHIRGLIEAHPSEVFSQEASMYDIDFEPGEYEGDDLTVGDTSHVSILAPNGDAVAVTTSVGYYFGCKDVSLSTGLIVNNHIRNFDFDGKTTNWSQPANELSPGKRPLTTMGPSVILDDNGDVKMVVGASGGYRIPTANAWVIIRTLLMNVPLDEAIKESRIHNNLLTNKAFYEKDFLQDVLNELTNRGHIVEKSSSFAAVQGIVRSTDGIAAFSDIRKGGKAAGY